MNQQQWQAEKAQFNDTSRYNDIMNLPRHVSSAHLPMPTADRAGQFSPFAALTGYKELLDKIAKKYHHKQYPSADQLKEISQFFRHLTTATPHHLRLVYFNGHSGYYDSFVGWFQKVDWSSQVIYFTDNFRVPLRNIKEVRETSN